MIRYAAFQTILEGGAFFVSAFSAQIQAPLPIAAIHQSVRDGAGRNLSPFNQRPAETLRYAQSLQNAL